jgi:glycosyltransferase involved in cell wall biosynthesis
MSKSPLVSVLVTPYNQKDYIRQTLDSILMQRCNFDFEVVIGEDCSTDGTREICQEYAQKYPDQIVLCLNVQNKGLINNYFDVFLKARGVYLADCGGDDYWLTDSKLQEQVDILETHSNVSLVAGNWQLYDQKSGILSKPTSWITQDWFQPLIFGKEAVANYLNSDYIPRIVLAASCFRGDWARELYEKHPELFRGNNVVCEDLPLTLGLLLKGPFYLSKNNWLVYRVLEKSLSHAQSRNDYVKGFAFAAFKQTIALATTLGIPSPSLAPYTRRKVGDFTLHSFMNEDVDFSETLQEACKKLDIRAGLKNILLQQCFRIPFLTSILRNLYRKRHPHL